MPLAAEFRLLGPLSVARDGSELQLGGTKQRAVLAILLLRRGQPVSAHALIDELWGESAPPAAAKTLQAYVSRLRRVLGDGAIVYGGSGYKLAIWPADVDAERFEGLLEQGRELLATERSKEALETLNEALALWRGPALADLAYESFAQPEISRLEELRLAALEERSDAELALGHHRRLVPELESLVQRHPLRERLRAQLMLALYRSGRQAEALEVYQAGRQKLVEDLGLEPGPTLQELERAILNQDPALAPSAPRILGTPTSRRGLALVALGGLVLAAAAAAGALEIAGVGGSTNAALAGAAPDSLARIDPHRDTVDAEIPVGSGPVGVTVGAGSVWVANGGDQTLARIDPPAKQVVDRIGLGLVPNQIAFGQGNLWATSGIGARGVVLRIDPTAERVVSHVLVRRGAPGGDLFAPPTPSTVAVGQAGVWTNELHAQLARIRFTFHGRVTTFNLGADHAVDGVAVGFGSVWVASGADDRVLRIDPRSGHVIAAIGVSTGTGARLASPYGIAAGAGAIWVANALGDSVSRIDPSSNHVVATIPTDDRPTRVAIGEGAVWVLTAGAGTVDKIDPRRNEIVDTIRAGRTVTGIAAGLGGVWVTVGGGGPRPLSGMPPPRVVPVSAASCSALIDEGGADLIVVGELSKYYGGPDSALAMDDAERAIMTVLRRHHFRVGRFRIGYQACDNSSLTEGTVPERCAANARAFALDPSVVGEIGPITSGCAQVALPVLNSAPGGPVAVISPTNTYVGLTRSGPATAADEPERYYPTGLRNYARLVAPDNVQSAGIVLFLKELGRKRLFVLDDDQGTGYAGAVYAAAAARRLGLHVVGRATWRPDASSYRPLARRIATAKADAVVLSGCICSNGALLVQDLRGVLGRRVTLIGTDNFSFTNMDGLFAGLYLSTAGRPADGLPPRGRRLVGSLRRDDPRLPDQLPAYAAEATELLLHAIAQSNGTRPSVTSALLDARDRDSYVGPVSFDDNGDPRPAAIAIYRVDAKLPRDPRRVVQGLKLVRVVEPRPDVAK